MMEHLFRVTRLWSIAPVLRLESKDRLSHSGKRLEAPAIGRSTRQRKIYLLGTLSYAGLIVYGSLYPLSGWRVPSTQIFHFVAASLPEHLSKADLLTNVLAYIPLGALIGWTIISKGSTAVLVVAGMAGGALSFIMESTQMFLPSRTSSNVDLLTNIAGVLLGAAIGRTFSPGSGIMRRLTAVRNRWFTGSQAVDAGLGALLLWALSQLSPFVPSADVSTIREGLSPLWYGWNNPSSLSVLKIAGYALDISGLGLLTTIMAHAQRRAASYFLLLAGIVFCLKPFIVGRQISLEALAGLVVAAVFLGLAVYGNALRALLAILCVMSGFVVQELTPVGSAMHGFHWIPFAGQVDNTVSGFGSILEGVWPFVALAALTMFGFGLRRKPMLYGGGIILLVVFGLEWSQQQVPGRYGDITTVLLATLGWSSGWLFATVDHRKPDRGLQRQERRAAGLGSRWPAKHV